MTKLKIILYFIFFYLFLIPTPAHAYLDPGNGSYLFQLLIAGFLGSSFFLKDGIKKIKKIFQNRFKTKKESDPDS